MSGNIPSPGAAGRWAVAGGAAAGMWGTHGTNSSAAAEVNNSVAHALRQETKVGVHRGPLARARAWL